MYEKPTSPILKKEGEYCPLFNYFFFPHADRKKERKLNRLLPCFNLLKELLQSIFVALRKLEGRSCEGFEVNRQIVEPVEGPITFHGVNDTWKHDI